MFRSTYSKIFGKHRPRASSGVNTCINMEVRYLKKIRLSFLSFCLFVVFFVFNELLNQIHQIKAYHNRTYHNRTYPTIKHNSIIVSFYKNLLNCNERFQKFNDSKNYTSNFPKSDLFRKCKILNFFYKIECKIWKFYKIILQICFVCICL